MTNLNKESQLQRLKALAAAGTPIIGGGAGSGLSARCQELGGVDILVLYNSGRYRMAGRGSLAGLLANGNANAIVIEMAREILPIVKSVPVLAGINAVDPFLVLPELFAKLSLLGISGVQNFPTVGLIDGTFRANLETTGMGYENEVAMIASAHSAGFLTTPYVFSVADAEAMASAGADIIVCHLGLTAGGFIGATPTISLDRAVELVDEWAEAALAIRPDVLVLCHGGPLATPEDAGYLLEHTKRCHGFYGASSMERLPIERAITDQVKRFKALTLG